MKIHNLSNLPTIDYRIVKPLQGDLKDLSRDNHDKLLRVLNKRGFTTPLFIWSDGETKWLIDGHQRHRVMVKNDLNDDGSYDVPYVLIPAASIEEAKEQLLEISSQYGTMTIDGLEEFSVDLDLSALDINFDAVDLGKLLADLDATDAEEDEAPELDETNPAISREGEIYQLGPHRLMCGDATSGDHANMLLAGAVPDLISTDPPYGIDIITDKHQIGADFGVAAKGKYSPVIGDSSTDTARDFYGLWSDLTNRLIIWGGNYFTSFLPFSDGWLIWDKRGDTGIRNSFADGEMAWCSFHTPVRIYTQLWNGMIREGEHDKRVHPTQKPVKTLAKIIRDHSELRQSIVDPFGGSGSTLMACEATDRICYMMELDPKYCDVIRKRYAASIGEDERWAEVTPAVGVPSEAR